MYICIGVILGNIFICIYIYMGFIGEIHIGVIFGTYWDNGKEKGNYHFGFRVLGFAVLEKG